MLMQREHKILLYDFYGALLTDRQRDVFTMHHMEDCSLAEVGETLGITPQAVSDMLRRTMQQLYKYEDKLRLAERHQAQKVIIQRLYTALDALGTPVNDIKSMINELLR